MKLDFSVLTQPSAEFRGLRGQRGQAVATRSLPSPHRSPVMTRNMDEQPVAFGCAHTCPLPSPPGPPALDSQKSSIDAVVPGVPTRPRNEGARYCHQRTQPDLSTQRRGIRLLKWEPKWSPVKLTNWLTVTDSEKFAQTTLAQVVAHLDGRNWAAGNWPLTVLIERLARVGVSIELTEPNQRLTSRGDGDSVAKAQIGRNLLERR